MKIKNFDENGNYIEPLYEIPFGENNETIYVTGTHLIYDPIKENFIFVKDFTKAKKSIKQTKGFSCLITSDHLMPIGKYIFHDWEDNNGSISKKLV